MANKVRRYGRGSVYKYRSGKKLAYRWQAWLPVNPLDANGDLERISVGGFETGREAQAALDEALRAVKALKPAKPAKVTLSFYADEWIDTQDLANSTLYGYRKIIRVHIKPHLGALELTQVTPEVIAKFYKKLRSEGRRDAKDLNGPLSANTVNKIHIVLGSILEAALDSGLIPINPARKRRLVKAPTGRSIRAEAHELETWTLMELKGFLKWDSDVHQDELHPLWTVMAWTGMRRGEALALKWGDLDLANGMISIRRAVDPVTPKVLKRTKTGRSRNVALTDEVLAVLRDLKVARAQLGLNFVQRDSLIFGNLQNEPRSPNEVTARFARNVKKAQKHIKSLPWLTLKGLRHTHATLMLQADVSPKVVQERLGHSNIGTTLNIYSHVTPTIQREAIDKFAGWADNA